MTNLLVLNHLKMHVTMLIQSSTHLVHLNESFLYLCHFVVMIVYSKGLALWKVWIYLILEDLVYIKVRKFNILSTW